VLHKLSPSCACAYDYVTLLFEAPVPKHLDFYQAGCMCMWYVYIELKWRHKRGSKLPTSILAD